MEELNSTRATAASCVRPFPGEFVSGDLGFVREEEDGVFLVLVDVAGHGSKAHEVAVLVEKILSATAARPSLSRLMQTLHNRLKGHLSAAIGMAYVTHETGEICFLGVGNVIARIVGRSRSHHFVSRDGAIGERFPAALNQSETLAQDEFFLLTTDGISSGIDADALAGYQQDSPGQCARRVVNSFGKAHDDAGCVACRLL